MWIGGDITSMSMVGTSSGLIEGEDSCAAICKFKSGAIGVIRHTWVCPRTSNPPRTFHFTWNIMCERGELTFANTFNEEMEGYLGSEGGGASPWVCRITVAHADKVEVLLDSTEHLQNMTPEIQHFLHCVRHNITPDTDAVVARLVMEVVLAAYADAACRGANPTK